MRFDRRGRFGRRGHSGRNGLSGSSGPGGGRLARVARCACAAGLAAGSLLVPGTGIAAATHAAQPCAAGLDGAAPAERLDCLQALGRDGSIARSDLRRVIDLLAASDASTDHRVVAAGLDVVRAAGATALADLDRSGEPAPEVLSALLPYRSPLYRDRDKALVVRLRAYLLVTLAEIGLPRSAVPALVDILAHVDETMPVLELVAATRAVRSLGDDGRPFIPYLLDALTVRSGAHEVSLERYEPDYPREEATTAQLEAVRSLRRVATAGDRDVAEVLGEITRAPGGLHDPRVVREAREALAEVQARVAVAERGMPSSLGTDPASPPGRLKNLDIAYTDHDGRTGVLADLVDRPTLLTFFYARCQNGKKCPMTIARLAALQRQLGEAGLADRVRLLAVTYEPQLDTPERLKRHTSARGLKLGDSARALRLDADRQQELLGELEIEVSYNAGWVNAHGVRLTLIGAGGDVVETHRDLAWRTEAVLKQLQGYLGGGRSRNGAD